MESITVTSRQQLLLQLLDVLGGACPSVDFQKILFLYCQQSESGQPYDFVPYKFGPFSFTSYEDRKKLAAKGLISADEGQWKLTKMGAALVEDEVDMFLSFFVAKLGSERGDELIAKTYRNYPYYATRSEIAERVLALEPEALASIRAAQGIAPDNKLFTIGYEGRSLEEYLNLLLRASVTILCDVRRNPLSRKYGFSKKTLMSACENVGIRYEHLPELGIDSEQRRDLRTQADYDVLFDDYRQHSLPKLSPTLATIQQWIEDGHAVALTCYEHLVQQCHRGCVAEALRSKYGPQFNAGHL